MRKEFMLIIGMLLMSNIFLVSAVDLQTNDKSDLFSQLKYQLNKLGLFTAEGQSRQCSVNPDFIWNPIINNSISKSEFLSKAGKPSALINRFNRNYQFIEEHRVEEIGSGIYFGGTQIVEVYGCPYSACKTNLDCKAPYGDTCNPTYGACYYSQTQPSHTTKVYVCDNGQFVLNRNAAYGQNNFCLDPTNNNYIDAAGNEHCAISPSSAWCPTTSTGGGTGGTGTGDGGTITQCSEKIFSLTCNALENCFWDNGVCREVTGTGGDGGAIENISLKVQKGISASKIEEMTTKDLFASSCTSTLQCENGSDCKTIGFLENNGFISRGKSEEIIKEGPIFFTSIGAASGIAACFAGAAALSIPTAGTAALIGFPLCGIAGASVGSQISEIISSFKSGSSSSIGYCILEKEDSFAFLEGLAFFDITGDGIKDGTDGLIITGGGFILLIILFRAFGGIYRYE